MAKKIALLMVALLLCSAVVFVSCSQNAGGNSIKPPREKVENDGEGTHSSNLVPSCDFEGSSHKVKKDGSDIEVVEGAGIGGSNALYVFQNSGEGYGEVLIDATEFYGRGKSYYVEASFKNIGGEGTPTSDVNAKIDFTVVSGAGYNKYKKTYDIPGQYDYDLLSDDKALEIFDMVTYGASGVAIDDETPEWHTLSAILDAETIDTMITKQTEDYGTSADEEPTLYLMSFVFLVGTHPSQDGYKYYLDNIKIIDLNSELDRTGKTWEDPSAQTEEDDDLE